MWRQTLMSSAMSRRQPHAKFGICTTAACTTKPQCRDDSFGLDTTPDADLPLMPSRTHSLYMIQHETTCEHESKATGGRHKGRVVCTCRRRLMKAKTRCGLTSAFKALKRRLRNMADLPLFAKSLDNSIPYKALRIYSFLCLEVICERPIA